MKKRFLYNQLVKYLDHKNALIVTGMRQVGKTTLLKQLFETIEGPKLWFDFDNPLDTMLFENPDYGNIFSRLQKQSQAGERRITVFVDEIQNFPEITKIIKYHIDHYSVKFIVTGSSGFYLKNLFPESLSGRKFLFILPPLTFQEFLYFNDIPVIPNENINSDLNFAAGKSLYDFTKYEPWYNIYLEYGGFPEVVTTSDEATKNLVLKNIFSSFFEKDLKILADFRDVRELRDLILLLVPRTGNILDITKLAGELGTHRVKIYNYLEFLQAVFFIKLVPKYSASIDRSVAGGKKVYFSDSGLLNIIGKVNEGQLFENTIANQLSNYGELSYYNHRNTAEIDFILNKEVALEVKLRGSSPDILKLDKLAAGIGLKNHWLISKNFMEGNRVIFPMFL